MRASSWLCPALTLLCATQLVYAAHEGSYAGYPLNNEVSEMLQSDYFLSKRNKPSLSIVNPLDVLRQRLLLEIARRQMKENSRQVELNRAILKNVGKRATSKYYSSPFTAALYRAGELQQQQEADSMQHLQPYEYQIIPTALIFDYLQQLEQRRPWLPYSSNAFDNNYMNDATEATAHTAANANEDDAGAAMENIEQNIIGLPGDSDKDFIKNLKQSNNEHSSHSPNEQHQLTAFQTSMNNRNDDSKTYTLKNNHPFYHHNNNLNLDVIDLNTVSAKPHHREGMTDSDSDYQLQHYIYHLHNNQNHLTRK